MNTQLSIEGASNPRCVCRATALCMAFSVGGTGLDGGAARTAHERALYATLPSRIELTHSADPVRLGVAGEPVSGCTEFVFALEPELMRSRRVQPVLERIHHWLEWMPEERICAPGDRQLRLEA